ncbi:hypothetical protein FQZ97_523770 [compost metagenome]
MDPAAGEADDIGQSVAVDIHHHPGNLAVIAPLPGTGICAKRRQFVHRRRKAASRAIGHIHAIAGEADDIQPTVPVHIRQLPGLDVHVAPTLGSAKRAQYQLRITHPFAAGRVPIGAVLTVYGQAVGRAAIRAVLELGKLRKTRSGLAVVQPIPRGIDVVSNACQPIAHRQTHPGPHMERKRIGSHRRWRPVEAEDAIGHGPGLGIAGIADGLRIADPEILQVADGVVVAEAVAQLVQ